MDKNNNHTGKKIINRFLNEPIKRNAYILIEYVKLNDITDEEILLLANGLADSGEKISLGTKNNVCDISSTGGPASLSTLLCPLFLVDFGATVLKLGVPGRPAGGIDVLAQISGFNLSPTISQISLWIEESKYVHFISNSTYAPLDALLFKFRKDNNAVSIPSLVIASLLSKKIAVNLDRIGLDVRVSEFGNFGSTWSQAKRNANRFNKIANLAGIKSKCFLTDGNIPQQPYIGRGEAILAMHLIYLGNIEPALDSHVNLCYRMAASLMDDSLSLLNLEKAKQIFFKNILVQGGSKIEFENIASQIESQHNYFIESDKDGYLFIDLEKIREAITDMQNDQHNADFPDPCGIILKSTTNQYINKGDMICTFRCPSNRRNKFKEHIIKAFSIIQTPFFINEFEVV